MEPVNFLPSSLNSSQLKLHQEYVQCDGEKTSVMDVPLEDSTDSMAFDNFAADEDKYDLTSNVSKCIESDKNQKTLVDNNVTNVRDVNMDNVQDVELEIDKTDNLILKSVTETQEDKSDTSNIVSMDKNVLDVDLVDSGCMEERTIKLIDKLNENEVTSDKLSHSLKQKLNCIDSMDRNENIDISLKSVPEQMSDGLKAKLKDSDQKVKETTETLDINDCFDDEKAQNSIETLEPEVTKDLDDNFSFDNDLLELPLNETRTVELIVEDLKDELTLRLSGELTLKMDDESCEELSITLEECNETLVEENLNQELDVGAQNVPEDSELDTVSFVVQDEAAKEPLGEESLVLNHDDEGDLVFEQINNNKDVVETLQDSDVEMEEIKQVEENQEIEEMLDRSIEVIEVIEEILEDVDYTSDILEEDKQGDTFNGEGSVLEVVEEMDEATNSSAGVICLEENKHLEETTEVTDNLLEELLVDFQETTNSSEIEQLELDTPIQKQLNKQEENLEVSQTQIHFNIEESTEVLRILEDILEKVDKATSDAVSTNQERNQNADETNTDVDHVLEELLIKVEETISPSTEEEKEQPEIPSSTEKEQPEIPSEPVLEFEVMEVLEEMLDKVENSLKSPDIVMHVDINNEGEKMETESSVHEIKVLEEIEEISDSQSSNEDIQPKSIIENKSISNTNLVEDPEESSSSHSGPPLLYEEISTLSPTSSDSVMHELPNLVAIQTQTIKSEKDVVKSTEIPLLVPIKKLNSRLTMAQLIERKLQGKEGDSKETDDTKNSEDIKNDLFINGHDDDTKQVKTDDVKAVKSPRKPIIGCVRKSVRKTERGRLTKPPWLAAYNTDDEDDQRETKEKMSVDEKIEEGNNSEEKKISNGTEDMRQQLCSQLRMLKVKKKQGSLFNAKIPEFTGKHYKKRTYKTSMNISDVATSTPSTLGFKIVAVSSGIDINRCKINISLPTPKILAEQVNDSLGGQNDGVEDEELENACIKSDNKVIINDHLDLPTIKLTKTKDYKKIKGWSKKKLLTLDDHTDLDDSNENIENYLEIEEDTKDGILLDEVEPQSEGLVETEESEHPTPGCSYLVSAGNEDTEDKTDNEIDREAGNVFASNSLDGFLQEKDLNISYNVPNLKSTNHNINLLDSCVLVDVEKEKLREQKEAELDLMDSNSGGSFKEKEDKNFVYKPRTLAEKRKMLSDELDGIELKKVKKELEKNKLKKFSRRPISSRFENNLVVKDNTTIKNENVEESLLVPMESKHNRFIKLPLEDDYIFLSEAESQPKNCITSQIKYKSSFKLQTCSVVTRKNVNRVFYSKFTDIRRKPTADLVSKSLLHAGSPKSKPSILKTESGVNYKPGPLCKKQELQVNFVKDLQTVIMSLPKINVEVVPEIGKKIHPIVRPFVRFDTFEVNKGRAEFALSAVRTKKHTNTRQNQTFQFPTRYKHKQEKVMMRKIVDKSLKKKKAAKEKYKPETEQEVLSACEGVVSRMLDFVEVKGIEDGLLKYDSDDSGGLLKDEVELELMDTHKDKDIRTVKDSIEQQNKTDKLLNRELRRLNVKITNLPDDDDEVNSEEKKTCSIYCRLGCVCQSITSRYPPVNHCGEARCIFTCICGFEAKCQNDSKEVKGVLNERAINRFNKEAVRNITAREEREFTQTAIRSKNKTIILGNNRVSKRIPKYNFKRYEGFHFSFNDDSVRAMQRKPLSEAFSQKIIQTDKKLLSTCAVNLVRCNFDDIVPFCLVHNLYDCHCRGLDEYSVRENYKKSEVFNAANYPSPLKSDPDDQNDDKRIDTTQIMTVSKANNNNMKLENPVNNPEGLSARMRPTGEFFSARNKTNKYKNIMARKLKYDTTVDPEVVNRWVILPLEVHSLNKAKNVQQQKPMPPKKDAIASIFDKKQLLEDEIINIDEDDETTRRSPRKRKRKQFMDEQVSDISRLADNELSVQNKVTKGPKRKSLKHIGTALTISGALYSPTEAIAKQFAAMIGNKATPLTEFRLLLWPSLIQLYELKQIQIWISNNTNKLRFIITDSLSTPKGPYDNIKVFEKSDPKSIKVEFIRWIVTKTIPEKKNSDNILVILRIQHMFWEICGICAKNMQNANTNLEGKQQPQVVTTLNEGKLASDSNLGIKEVIQTVDEKYYKTVQHVVFANGSFAPKKLVLENPTESNLGALRMSAALPHIVSNCRWRVLKVNSNFAILAFARNEFRIKCSDILTVMKVAVQYNKTIIINTEEVSQNYQHKLFGIYIPPTYQDRIFIGPFLHDEDHCLETLRFVNNELMNTADFNAMRGITNVANTGLWYQQYGRVTEPPKVEPVGDSVIDLTDMDEVRSLIKSTDVTITASPVHESTSVLPAATTGTERVNRNNKKFAMKKSLLSVKKSKEIIEIIDHLIDKNEEIVVNDIPPLNLIPQKANIFLRHTGDSMASLLIPTKTSDNQVAYKQVNLKPQIPQLSMSKEHVDVAISQPGKMPELIRIPLKANKLNRDITRTLSSSETSNSSFTSTTSNLKENPDNAVDPLAIDSPESTPNCTDTENVEKCFNIRLKIIMKQMNMVLPRSANPICFRLNFGNGVILGYSLNNEIFIYWPGDSKKQFYFSSMQSAIQWLCKELHEVFICVPSTFTIKVIPVDPPHYMEYMNRGVISQKYFREICIIGDFGIMRLSEAQKYLMCDKDEARAILNGAEGKTPKFKKAIGQIIDGNNYTKEEFKKEVKELIKRAKAAADKPKSNLVNQSPSTTNSPKSRPPVLHPSTQLPTPTANQQKQSTQPSVSNTQDDVICLDSDEEEPPVLKPILLKRVPNPNIYQHNGQLLKKQKLMRQKNKQHSRYLIQTSNVASSITKKKDNVMKIDLTHMTTENVRQLLKSNERGDNITLTADQVKRLKALSRSPVHKMTTNAGRNLNQNGKS